MKHLQTMLIVAFTASLGLAVTAARAEGLPVSVIKLVERDRYQVERVYAGQLKHQRTSQLGFEFAGVVESITVAEGDVIKRGDVLMSLADEALQAELRGARARLATARANVIAQEAQLELAGTSLKRYEELVETGHGSEQRLDELQIQSRVDTARVKVLETQVRSAEVAIELILVNLDKTKIVAPYDGILQNRMVDEGTVVSPGQTVLTLVEKGPLEARIGIPVQLIGRLQRDKGYEFRIDGRVVPARMTAVLPVADITTGTVTVLFHLDDNSLYAGTLAELILNVEVKEEGFWLPVSALSESQRGLWSVLVVDDDGTEAIVTSSLVEILYRGRDQVYVRGSLKSGDNVVSGGTGRIVPGQSVRISQLSLQIIEPG